MRKPYIDHGCDAFANADGCRAGECPDLVQPGDLASPILSRDRLDLAMGKPARG